MMGPRASIFEDSDDIDISGFAPKSEPDTASPSAEQVRAVSEAAKFRSREPKSAQPASPKREQRRHRTGRNVQFNVKVTPETMDAFYAITDSKGWVLGETLEHALAALKRELSNLG